MNATLLVRLEVTTDAETGQGKAVFWATCPEFPELYGASDHLDDLLADCISALEEQFATVDLTVRLVRDGTGSTQIPVRRTARQHDALLHDVLDLDTPGATMELEARDEPDTSSDTMSQFLTPA